MKTLSALIHKGGTVRGMQIFQLFRFASYFITGIILAKSGIGAASIGIYESLIFIAGAFSFFWISGILNSLLITFPKTEEQLRKKTLFNTAVLICFINIILVSILYLAREYVGVLLPQYNKQLYLYVVLYMLVNNPAFINEYILLIHNRTSGLAFYGLINFIITVSAVVVPVLAGYGIETSFKFLILTGLFKILLLIFLLKKFSEAEFIPELWKRQISISIPLITGLLVSGSAEYIDGFLISTHFGPETFAIFRYGARELPLSLILANAMSTAMIPRLAANIQDKEGMELLRKEGLKLMHVLFPVTILLLFSSGYLYPLIFSEEFSASVPVFNLYLLLLISRMIFPQTVVMATGKTRVIMMVSLAEIIINITASYLLMLEFGITGVAYGTIFAFFSEKLILALYLKYKAGLNFYRYTCTRAWFLYTILLLLTWIIVNNFES